MPLSPHRAPAAIHQGIASLSATSERASVARAAWPASLALLALLALLAGCNPPAPTTLEIVAPGLAPGLTSPKSSSRSGMTLHEGDVLIDRQGRFPKIKWSGELEGQKLTREGDVVEFKRSQRDGSVYSFDSDLRRGVPVTSAEWLCATSPKPIELAQMPCAEVIQRIRIDERTTAAFLPCLVASCPLGIAVGSKTSWTTVDGLSEMRLARLAGRPYLAGLADYQKGPARGVSLHVFDAALGLTKKVEIVLESNDQARAPVTLHRSVKTSFEGDVIRARGTLTETNTATGTPPITTPIDETYRFSSFGRVTLP